MAAAGTLVALVAEFIGTFLLTLVSCASAAGSISDDWGPTAVGFTYAALIYSFSGVSGGHLNPAVTLASALVKKFPWWTTLYYIVAQLFGGALGGGVFRLLFNEAAKFEPQGSFGYWQPIVVETLYTAMLAFVVLSVTSLRNLNFNQYYALASGFVLVAAGHAAGPVSGAAINPAISLGAGLTSGDGGLALQGFLYVHYQVIGAIFAALTFAATRPEDSFAEERLPSYSPALTTSLIGEWVGSFLIAFTMSLAVLGESSGFAWATGAAVLSLLYSLGDVSGSNFNPAITLAAGMLKRGCTLFEGLLYVLTQLLGSFAGALVAAGVYGNSPQVGPVVPFGIGAALLMEFLFTTLVVYVFLSTVCIKSIVSPLSRNYFFGLAVGFAVAGGMFVTMKISGGFLNPALACSVGLTSVIAGGGNFLSAFTYMLMQGLGGLVAAGLFHSAQLSEYSVLSEKVL